MNYTDWEHAIPVGIPAPDFCKGKFFTGTARVFLTIIYKAECFRMECGMLLEQAQIQMNTLLVTFRSAI